MDIEKPHPPHTLALGQRAHQEALHGEADPLPGLEEGGGDDGERDGEEPYAEESACGGHQEQECQ